MATPTETVTVIVNDPSLSLFEQCDLNSQTITFTITNNGGSMTSAGSYSLNQPGVGTSTGSVNLAAGASMSFGGKVGNSSISVDYSTSQLSNVHLSNTGNCLKPTPTLTPSSTPTVPTKTRTPTATKTDTLTPSATYTASNTYTPSPTYTASNTYTPSVTRTPTNTRTATATKTDTLTPSQTFTPSITPTPSMTYTASGTYTPSATKTPTNTKTPTATKTITPTKTDTLTPSQTYTPSKTNTPTQTYTPSNTYTPSVTRTPTDTRTPTATKTITPTPSITLTPSQTFTPSMTLQPPSIGVGISCNVDKTVNFTIVNTGGPLTGGSYSIDTPSQSGGLNLPAGGHLNLNNQLGYSTLTVSYSDSQGNQFSYSETGNCLPYPTATASLTPSLTATVQVSKTPSVTPSITLTPSLTLTPTTTLTATWGKSSLSASGSCVNNQLVFTVTNQGSGPMSSGTSWTVTDSAGNVIGSGTTKTLAVGESQQITLTPPAGNYPVTFIVNQEAGHPGTGTVKATIDTCNVSTATPTATITVTPSKTLTPSKTPTITLTPSNTPTDTLTPSKTPTDTLTPSKTPTITLTPSNTPTDTLTPSKTPTDTLTPSKTPTDTLTPSKTPTDTLTPSNTPTFTLTPSNTPKPPHLTGNGTCDNGSAVFTITNDGELTYSGSYTINGGGKVLASGAVTLTAGQSTQVSGSGASGTITLQVTETSTGTVVSFGTNCVATATNTPTNTPTFTLTPSSTPTFTLTPTGTLPPSLTGNGICVSGTVTFTVTNNGGSPIPSGVTYAITDSSGKSLESGTLKTLAAGDSTTFTINNVTGTLTLTVSSQIISAIFTAQCIPDVSTTPTATPVTPTATVPPVVPHIAWAAIAPAPAVCEDWLVYHTDQVSLHTTDKGTGQEIFRLGDLPNQPGTPVDLSQTPNLKLPDGTPVQNAGPSLSPDRRYMVFASNRDGQWNLYVAPTSGIGAVKRMTYDAHIDVSPAWSPDGKYVVYESAQGGNWNLYLFDVTKNGAEPVQITDTPATDSQPYWSQDSKQIVFESNRSGTVQLYVYDLASKQTTRLTNDANNDFNPTYSPDGKHIAYRSYTAADPNNGVLYIADADGKNAKAVSVGTGNALSQSWSSNSDLIAYQSNMMGQNDIYVYQVSTGKTRLVTDASDKVAHYAPTWYCNSTTLIFTSDVTGNANVFSTDGSVDLPPIKVATQAKNLTNLTKFQAHYAENFPPQEEEGSRLILEPGPKE